LSNENENVKRIFEKQVEAVRPSKRRPKPKQLADQVISNLETKIVAAKIYLEKIEQALELPNSPREQLLQVKDLLSRFVSGVQAVQELPKNAPKTSLDIALQWGIQGGVALTSVLLGPSWCYLIPICGASRTERPMAWGLQRDGPNA
jgi:hypothetical protein